VTRRSILKAVAGLAALSFAPPALAADPTVLKVALLPDENAATIIQNNKGLELYLEKALGKKIELIVTTDYSSMIEAMRFKRIDLGYFGPLSYLLAKSRAPDLEPFAALVVNGQPTYKSCIIARSDSGITKLTDLRGKTLGFGDPASTSSNLVPRYVLQRAGLIAGKDYQFQHLGAHDAVARAVQAGNIDAGGLSRPIFDSLVAKGSIDPAKVKVIVDSAPIPNYPWTMRGDLSPALKQKLRAAFYGLKDPAVLKAFKGDGFQPIKDSDYDGLRATAKILNLDLAKVK
jgi:phosphonate transport system substrate-binding protein